MKIKIIILLAIVLTLSGCIKRDSFEDILVYTTVYPAEYTFDRLYGDYSTIKSIYPEGVDIDEYELTEKQIVDYSIMDLYVFNSNGKEKEFVVPFFEKNKDLKIIDVSSTIDVDINSQLWMDPSNYLKFMKNIRDGLFDYIDNQYFKNEINSNYEELRVEVSLIEANLRQIANNSKEKYIVIGDENLLFLKKYGFNTIDAFDTLIERDEIFLNELIQEEKISGFFTIDNKELNDYLTNIINENETLEIFNLRSGTLLTAEEQNNNVDYIQILNENILTIRSELYN